MFCVLRVGLCVELEWGVFLGGGLGCESGFGEGIETEVALFFYHSSFCSARTAPTRRMTAWRLGKIPTESVRRRISRLRRSLGLLDRIWVHTPVGKDAKVRMSARA